MRNTLGDLNNLLFEQLERIMDADASAAELETELKRSRAVTGLASQVVANGQLALDAKKFVDDTMDADARLPRMLEG